jgi:hypothetical protein
MTSPRFSTPLLTLCFLFLISACSLFESKPKVEERFADIIGIAEVTTHPQEQAELHKYLEDTLSKYPRLSQDSLFYSWEFDEFLYDHSIELAEYIDWKSITTPRIESFAEHRLEDFYKSETPYVRQLQFEGSIPDSLYELTEEWVIRIGDYLMERDYALCNLDCNCDCVRMMLIPDESYEKTRMHAFNLGCNLEHWGKD